MKLFNIFKRKPRKDPFGDFLKRSKELNAEIDALHSLARDCMGKDPVAFRKYMDASKIKLDKSRAALNIASGLLQYQSA